MTNANERQVGGEHYQGGYQHWDLVTRTGMGYLAGQATKYLARWRKKNGLEDLEKAAHYIQKALEVHEERRQAAIRETELFVAQGGAMPEILPYDMLAVKCLALYGAGDVTWLRLAEKYVSQALRSMRKESEAAREAAQAEVDEMFSTMPNLNC